jgi:hypothetical protein
MSLETVPDLLPCGIASDHISFNPSPISNQTGFNYHHLKPISIKVNLNPGVIVDLEFLIKLTRLTIEPVD